jgi:2-oxoglutarate dehydrogenase E2 component (dihydrolipoamide succinyltransferase)
MPALGESVTEGTVTRWLKNEGDSVAVDEPLLEVSTDKVDTEIPSPVAGIVEKILVTVDSVVPVGAQLVLINDGSAASPVAPAAPVATPAPVSTPAPIAAAPVAATPAAPASSGNSASVVVTMPALGESVTEGTVTRWLKNVGDSINADESLLEVSTDKVDTEIPSPASGIILSIDVHVDSTVPVGAPLATIGSSSAASAPAPAAPAPVTAPVVTPPAPVAAAPVTPAPVAPAPVVSTPVAPAPVVSTPIAPTPVAPTPVAQGGASDLYITPIIRKLAKDLNVDLSRLSGTGVAGRIRREDVEAAARAVSAAQYAAPTSGVTPAPVASSKSVSISPLRGTTVEMSRLRKVIAQRMVESLQTSAQLTTVVEVDITKIARLRDRAKAGFEAREGVKLTFLPFFSLAVCEALKQHPAVNASINGDSVTYHGAEHLGIAVDTERGLLVPVIKDAGDLNIGALARKIVDVAARTRDNKISPDELGGGTFTITNTGSRGALFDTPIINQPQVAILGVGAVVKRPVVVNNPDTGDTIAVRSMVYLALSYDHRIVDGADAARFLSTLKERLEAGNFESDLAL